MDRLSQQGYGRTVYIEGAGHYNFTDLQLYSPLIGLTGMTGSMNGARGAEIVNRYLLEFSTSIYAESRVSFWPVPLRTIRK